MHYKTYVFLREELPLKTTVMAGSLPKLSFNSTTLTTLEQIRVNFSFGLQFWFPELTRLHS